MNIKRRKKNRILFWLLGLAVLSGCASTSDTWVGSADAVFRYRPQDQSTVVYQIHPDSASEKAGLKPGDRILAIDGQDITNASYEIIQQALRGPVGSNVLLTIERGSKIMEIKIERRPIRDESN